MNDSISENLFNPALGAVLLGQFGAKWRQKEPESTFDSWKAILVLPMAFHQVTINHIHRMQFRSGLDGAISNHPQIMLGLHERVLEFLALSYQSLLTAHSLKWLDCSDMSQIKPRLAALPRDVISKATAQKTRLEAVDRLAVWFQQYASFHLFQRLGVSL